MPGPVLTLAPAAPVHPAIYTAGTSPPPTPTPCTPLSAVPTRAPAPPRVSHALLRAHHACALRAQISRLRLEQADAANGYLRGEDAWINHDRVVGILADELRAVVEAQKTLDQFPDVPAAVWYPAPHGPPTRAELDKKLADEFARELAREREISARLDEAYPWLRQLYIGPMTRRAARNDKMLREQLANNIWDDLQDLLPSENLELAMHPELLKPGAKRERPAGAKKDAPKKTYDELRLEREQRKVAAMMKEAGIAVDDGKAKGGEGKGDKKDGAGKEDRRGDKEVKPFKDAAKAAGKDDAGKDDTAKDAAKPTHTDHAGKPADADGGRLLGAQREQRRILMEWLRRPWPTYHDRAAGEIEGLARIAWRELEQATRAEAKAKAAEGGESAAGGSKKGEVEAGGTAKAEAEA